MGVCAGGDAVSDNLPNINIALPPPPAAHPPSSLPCLDRLLTSPPLTVDAASPSPAEDLSCWAGVSCHGDPLKATDFALSASLMDSSDPSLSDHLLMLFNKHKPLPPSDSPQLAETASLFESPAAKLSPSGGDTGVKSAGGWLDRLMSGSTQDVFSDFRPAELFPTAEVLSDMPPTSQCRAEQPPSPLQKFNSWQQETRLPFLPARSREETGQLRDILGLLAADRGRERAASLPQAEPGSPSPNALQVPEAPPSRLWGSAENLQPPPDFLHRRLQQAASMELQRSADLSAHAGGETASLRAASPPPPPPRSRRAPAKGWWKTEVCKFWKEGTGCRNGANCRWAHGDGELRRMDADPSPRHGDAVSAETAAAFSLSPSVISRPAWSHERLEPLPRPSVSPSLGLRDATLFSDPNNVPPVSRWAVLPIQHMTHSFKQRACAIEDVWQLVRMKNLPFLSLMENLLISSAPGIRADVEYWEDLLGTLCGVDPEDRRGGSATPPGVGLTPQGVGLTPGGGLRRCLLCGTLDPMLRDAVSVFGASPLLPEQVAACTPLTCERCAQIAEHKAHSGSLFPPAEFSSYDSEPENRPSTWSYKLAQFMRSCEDGSWLLRSEHGNILRKGQTVNLWVQHQRYIARVWFVFHICLRALDGGRRVHYQSLQFLEGLSLVEWTAVAHQPVLFAVLLLSCFPVNRSSIPSSLASLAVSLDAWRLSLYETRSPPRPRFLAPPSRTSEQQLSAAGKGLTTSLGTPSKRSTSPTGTATPADIELQLGGVSADEILLSDEFTCYKALMD